MEEFEAALLTMCDQTRWRIVKLLSEKRLCGRGIAAALNLSEAAVSQHLAKLVRAGLVNPVSGGYWVFYVLQRNRIEKIRSLINILIQNIDQNRSWCGVADSFQREKSLMEWRRNYCLNTCKVKERKKKYGQSAPVRAELT